MGRSARSHLSNALALTALAALLLVPALTAGAHSGHARLQLGAAGPALDAAPAAGPRGAIDPDFCPICLALGQARASASAAFGALGGLEPWGREHRFEIPTGPAASSVDLAVASPRAPPLA